LYRWLPTTGRVVAHTFYDNMIGFSLIVLCALWLAYQACRVALRLVGYVLSKLIGWVFRVKVEVVGGIHDPPAGAYGQPIYAPVRMRLRRRSGWVCRLQAVLEGEVGVVSALRAGRWTPDLPSTESSRLVNFVSSLVEDGVQIQGGGSVMSEGEDPALVYYVHLVDSSGNSFTVFPDLLAALVNRAAFRARTSALTALLRLKALEWRREVKLSHHDFAYGLQDCVSLALRESSWSNKTANYLSYARLTASGQF